MDTDCYVWCGDTTIPSMDQTNETCAKQDLKEITTDISNWKEADLETLDKIITDRELEELIEAHGINS